MSSLLSSEPHTHATGTALTAGWSVAAVRDALQSGDRARIERDVTAFYNRCFPTIERFARNLVQKGESVGLNAGVDSEDIASEAFDKVFTLVSGDGGERVRDETHLLRILFRAARCVWVDAARLPDTRHSFPRSDHPELGDEPISREPTPDEKAFGVGRTALVALRLLFTDGERLGRLLRKSGAGTRHVRQYRALALYELGERLRDDLDGATGEAEMVILRFWRHLAVDTICVRLGDWMTVEAASRWCVGKNVDTGTYLYEPIRATVETVCGADLLDRGKRHLLRHEMGRLLALSGGEIERIGRE